MQDSIQVNQIIVGRVSEVSEDISKCPSELFYACDARAFLGVVEDWPKRWIAHEFVKTVDMFIFTPWSNFPQMFVCSIEN